MLVAYLSVHDFEKYTGMTPRVNDVRSTARRTTRRLTEVRDEGSIEYGHRQTHGRIRHPRPPRLLLDDRRRRTCERAAHAASHRGLLPLHWIWQCREQGMRHVGKQQAGEHRRCAGITAAFTADFEKTHPKQPAAHHSSGDAHETGMTTPTAGRQPCLRPQRIPGKLQYCDVCSYRLHI